MNNIDLYIEELEASKVEIKEAIIAKGVTPEGGLSSYAAAIESITISDPTLEELSVQLTENGTYNYTPTDDGYSSVEVIVDVPEPDLRQLNLSVTENGYYEYDTPDNIDGYSKVNLTVDVPTSGGGDSGKPKIYNGFRLTDNAINYGDVNAFRQIDFSQYDWSGVYDTGYFFAGLSKSIGSNVNDGLVDADFDNFRQHYNGKMLNCMRLFDVPNISYPSLLEFPNFGNMTRGCINMSYLCYNQKKITNVDNIANWNTSSVLNMSGMFNGCSNLTSVPLFDTSNVTNMSGMLSCSQLIAIPLLDCSKISTGNNMNICSSTTLSKLTDVGGFKDLGKVSSFNKPSYFLKSCPNLTKESVLNVLNNLYDRKTAGYSVVTLPFNSASLALLSDEEKAIATNKGWTLATS